MKKVPWMKDSTLGACTLEASGGERSEPLGAVGIPDAPDPEVTEKPGRRKFSAQYKLRILQPADGCTTPGSLGRLLRREDLSSSHLTTWRRQRDKGILQGLRPVKRGRKPSEPNPLLPELEKLRKENVRWEKHLKQAERV